MGNKRVSETNSIANVKDQSQNDDGDEPGLAISGTFAGGSRSLAHEMLSLTKETRSMTTQRAGKVYRAI